MARIRQAIYRVLPRKGRTVELFILALFSALESDVLIHRRSANLEYTIANTRNWKKIERKLRQTISDCRDMFSTQTHMNMLLQMLPSLKRVPLKDAFISYIGDTLDLSDLWPVFGPSEGATLNDVRNRLIHGDSFADERFAYLCHAMDNLECIVKRLILFTLKWDIEKSNVAKDVFKKWGWIANANLRNDMIALASRKTKDDKN